MTGLEERKKIEQEHFNRQMESLDENLDISKIENIVFRTPFAFAEQWLKTRCCNKKILDYGCGSRAYSILLTKYGAEVTGIDISDLSIDVARKRAEREGVNKKTSFFVMDCEKLEFDNNSFDIIFSRGTLSYLNLPKALSEMVRVLKPDGYVVAIDTLGHNPVLNLNRRIKAKKGLRSKWMVEHILKMKNIKQMKTYFGNIEMNFFHLATMIIAPFCRRDNLITKKLLSVFEKIDAILLKSPILQRYAFKLVIILSVPKKDL